MSTLVSMWGMVCVCVNGWTSANDKQASFIQPQAAKLPHHAQERQMPPMSRQKKEAAAEGASHMYEHLGVARDSACSAVVRVLRAPQVTSTVCSWVIPCLNFVQLTESKGLLFTGRHRIFQNVLVVLLWGWNEVEIKKKPKFYTFIHFEAGSHAVAWPWIPDSPILVF